MARTASKPITAAARKAAQVPVRAGYARISIEEARTGSSSLARQIEGIRRLDPEMRVFVDDGVSGTHASRPAFDELLRYVEEEGVNEIYAARLDRLGRNHELKVLLPRLYHEKGCRIVCTEEESPDLDTDIGRLLFDLKCNINCGESDRNSRRVRASAERQFRKARFMHPTAGYLLVNGNLVPDDMPRHCPLQMKQPVSGPCDEHGIATDAFVGLSAFDIVSFGLKSCVRLGSPTAALRLVQETMALTEPGSWDPARSQYTANNHRQSVLEILLIDGNLVEARRLIGDLTPSTKTGLMARLQCPTYHGHFAARPDWDESYRPSLGKKKTATNTKPYQDKTYEFFEENTHPSALSPEDIKALEQWNQERKAAASNGTKVPAFTGLERAYDEVTQLRIQTAKLVLPRCFCEACGKRMTTKYDSRKRVDNGKMDRRYVYAYCHNTNCKHNNMIISMDDVIGGVALHLAEAAKRIQSGLAPAIKERPTVLAEIRELEEDLAEVLKLKSNRVRSNLADQLRKEIEALRAGGTAAAELEQAVAHRRLEHPRAVEAGAWLQLMSQGGELLAGVMTLIRAIYINYPNGVRPSERAPRRPGVRGRQPKYGPVLVRRVELVTEG